MRPGASHKTQRLSVILCTYNPRADFFERALKAVSAQTLSPVDFEFIIVDNNSSPPIDETRVAQLASRPVRVVREARQGLIFARVAGIKTASAPLLCFIDDDNEVDARYFEEALRIADDEPALGAFGGIARGELERPVSSGFAHFLPYLGVNEHGQQPLTGPGDAWGAWVPIGAGLCVRRDVAASFALEIERLSEKDALGRRGRVLMSGEDTLFSRLAHRLGYVAGYRPALRLTHLIAAERLTLGYLARLMEGHGRSRIILDDIAGATGDTVSARRTPITLFMNFLHRLKSHGPTRAYGMYFWDLGQRRQRGEMAQNRDSR